MSLRTQIVTVVVTTVLVAGCGRGPANPAEAPGRVTNVRVEVLRAQTAEDRLVIPGTVEAWADVLVAAEVEGRVEAVAADEGDTVAANQVLFEIDPWLLRAQMKEAEAALAALNAEQQKVKAGARPEELAIAEATVRGAEAAVNQAQAGLAQAQAAEQNAQRDLARTQKLFTDNVVPPERLDAAETAATIARKKRETAEEQRRGADEQLMAARGQLRLLREGARREDRDAIAARVAQAQVALDLAQTRLQKASVKAPIEGILNTRHVDAGEYVKVGTPLADIVNIDRVKLVVPVPEKDISFVRTGDTREVIVDAVGRRRMGTVIFQSRVADPKTLTFDVKVELDNPGGLMRPGMVGRVTLVRRRLTNAIAVPIFTVLKRDLGYVVFLENNGRAEETFVELGFFEGDKVIVQSGLRAGDRLIVEGHRDLVDGDTVRVVDPYAL